MAKPKFSVCLDLGGAHYTTTGPTVIKALDKLKPAIIKACGKLIVISADGRRSERVLYPFQIKKLLINPMFKQIFEKNMLATLK